MDVARRYRFAKGNDERGRVSVSLFEGECVGQDGCGVGRIITDEKTACDGGFFIFTLNIYTFRSGFVQLLKSF